MKKEIILADYADKLCPIYKLRIDAFIEINPDYFKANEREFILSAMVAQDYLHGGHSPDRHLVSNLHKKWNLDRGADVNPFLVDDLINAYLGDFSAGLIDKKGVVIAPRLIKQSKVLSVVHNSKRYGIPVTAEKTITAVIGE